MDIVVPRRNIATRLHWCRRQVRLRQILLLPREVPPLAYMGRVVAGMLGMEYARTTMSAVRCMVCEWLILLLFASDTDHISAFHRILSH